MAAKTINAELMYDTRGNPAIRVAADSETHDFVQRYLAAIRAQLVKEVADGR